MWVVVEMCDVVVVEMRDGVVIWVVVEMPLCR